MENKNYPLVTVVVPTYNHGEYVGECIESILTQDYPLIELIVVNDGSTDDTDEVIEKLKKVNKYDFTYITKENEGVGKTMAKGLSLAKGEFFMEVCADDILVAGSVEKRVDAILNNDNVDFIFANAYRMKDREKTKELLIAGDKQGFDSRRHSFKDFAENRATIILHSGILRVKTFKELGGYDSRFYTEDVYLRYLLALKGNVAFLDEPVLYYREHGTNISKGKPFWMRKEKILSLETLLSIAGNNEEKEEIKSFLFDEYLKFLKRAKKEDVKEEEINEVFKKAKTICPVSLKLFLYKLFN